MKHAYGKHGERRSARFSRRPGVAALVVLAACLAAAGGTLAWYSQQSSLTNMFGKGELAPEIQENFDSAAGSKSDVAVAIPENTSNVPAYVRAQIDIYWEDAQGNRMWEAPVAAGISDAGAADTFDYEIVWANLTAGGQANSWIAASDGIYYWSSPVQPGGITDPLIVSLQEHVRHDDGRRLVATVSTQAIQAEPARAFDESWGPHCGLAVGANGVLSASASVSEGGDR